MAIVFLVLGGLVTGLGVISAAAMLLRLPIFYGDQGMAFAFLATTGLQLIFIGLSLLAAGGVLSRLDRIVRNTTPKSGSN